MNKPRLPQKYSDAKMRSTADRNRLKLRGLLVLIISAMVAASSLIFATQSKSAAGPAAAPQADTGISDSALQQIAALLHEKETRTPAQRKIDSQLLCAYRNYEGEPMTEGVPTMTAAVDVNDGMTVVDISAVLGGTLYEDIEAGGGEVLSALARYNSLRARVRLDQLESIAENPQVQFIQPMQEATVARFDPNISFDQRAETTRRIISELIPEIQKKKKTKNDDGLLTLQAGSVNSQGDLTHRAAEARSVFGVNGSGVKVGVLSNGVVNLAASRARGDLPANVTVLPGQTGAGDEGTAMLEIIHDLAPGAQLFFATAFTSITSFAQNIRDLRTAGCDIIVDDVLYFAETPFQDGQMGITSNTNGGVVIQAVNDVTADGALFFSSAGNSGNKNDNRSGVWEGDFVDGGPPSAPISAMGSVHNFGGGVLFNTVTAVGSGQYNLFWSDPLGGSSNDYDLFVVNSAGTAVVTSSTNLQTGTQDPFELIAPTATNTRIVILKKPSAAGRYLHLNTNRGRLSINTDGQTRGHNSAANAFGCAATPAVGPFPNPFSAVNTVELFSSDGPRRIFFTPNSTPITPGNFSSTGGLLRQKPDITAADGTSVTGVGGFGSPFFGTSAAAPHAAAIAALVKSAGVPLTPAQVRTALTSTAIDIEAPGVDRDSGAGIIMAFDAVQSLGIGPQANVQLGTVTATESPGNGNGRIDAGEGAALSVQLTNMGAVNAAGITVTLATVTPDVIITQPAAATYPDLPATSGVGTGNFRFTVDSDAPCPLTIDFTLTVTYLGGPSPKVLTFSVNTGAPPFLISSTLDGVAPTAGVGFTAMTGTQQARHNRNGLISSCASVKAFPGIAGGTATRLFDAYTFTTCASASPVCVTVTLTNACTGSNPAMFGSAYLNSFDPTNLATNYRADAGVSQIAAGPASFSFTVAGGSTFVVVVSEVNSGFANGCNYTLSVSGFCVDCTTPNQLPIAQCQNVTVSAGPACTANASIDNGSSDPENGPLTLTQTPAGPYPLGVTAVLLTVTDDKGAQSQCSGTVTVVDTTPPVISCPANIVTSAGPGVCSATASYTATATDGCGSPGVACSPPSGSTFPVGTTTVTCTATDAAGNTATCSFTVKVNDVTPPAIQCPADITLQGAPGAGSTTVNYPAPVASDNCSATVVCIPPSGSAFPAGVTTVTCTATDPSGNTATCSFKVSTFNLIVRDNASNLFIRVAVPAAGGPAPYEFFDCSKGVILKGTGVASVTSCKIEVKDPVGATKPPDITVVVNANKCTLAGSASIKIVSQGKNYALTDTNISNNPLSCP